MEMGASDDTLYFTCLEDRQQTFLLQNNSEDICEAPTLNMEPIFREIFFSGSYILENTDQVSDEPSLNVNGTGNSLQDLCPETDNNDHSMTDEIPSHENNSFYPIEVPEKSFVTTDLFTPNDLLLQLNLQCEDITPDDNQLVNQSNATEEQNINDVKTILFSENLTVENESNSNEHSDYNEQNDVTNEITTNRQENIRLNLSQNLESEQGCNKIIQLLNTDGSVINIDKSLLSPSIVENQLSCENEGTKLEDFYEVVSAYKCKECSFLCEKNEEITRHIKESHLVKSEKRSKAIFQVDSKTGQNSSLQKIMNGEVKMVSILNKNLNNNAAQQPVRKTLFLCSQCNIGYTKKEMLKSHFLMAHPVIKQVPKQEETYSVESKINEANKIKQDKLKLSANLIKKQQKAFKKIKCSIKGCDLRFARDDTRKRHESCHIDGQKKQFACIECGEKFSIWRICSTHLWKCHKIDMDLLTCPMCNNFKASSSFRLISHMSIHNDEKPFLCSTCGKTFKNYSQLHNHQVIHKEVSPDWMAQQQCEICQKYFANSKCLKKHVQCVHNKYKPFICNVCGHKTARKAMLELHLRQHTGEKPHKCPICEYKTGDHNSLRRHMMRHSGDMKYSCPHCDYQSIQSAAYKKHMANKHPGLSGVYVCEQCPYHTVNEIAYSSHMSDHEKGLINYVRNDAKCDVIDANKIAENIFIVNHADVNPSKEVEDDETQNFLSLDNSDEAVDTGGITIPESLDL